MGTAMMESTTTSTTATTTTPNTTGVTGGRPAGARTSPVWLETPLLRFVGVEQGLSLALPIVVRGLEDHDLTIEVVAPPLAPFSVTETPAHARHGRQAGQREARAELWVRYDATSPMAVDSGQITIREIETGRQWTVALDGTGALAKPFC
ncbi:MAG: hypothetical protein ACR2QK_25135 [Acidimicrobiales bacterium]